MFCMRANDKQVVGASRSPTVQSGDVLCAVDGQGVVGVVCDSLGELAARECVQAREEGSEPERGWNGVGARGVKENRVEPYRESGWGKRIEGLPRFT